MRLEKHIKKMIEKYDTEFIISTEDYLGYNHFYFNGKEVESISLSDVELINIEELLPFSSTLKRLSLEDCFINDLSNIEQFQCLEFLRISRGISPLEIKKISSLRKLKHLEIIDLELKDISFLQSLSWLEFLNVSHNEITEVNSFNELKNLKKIKISYNKINSISNIDTIDSLEIMDLSYSKFNDYKTIERFQNLKEINFRFSNIRKTSNLKLLPNLEKIDFSFTKIDDVRNIGRISALKILEYICPFNLKVSDLNKLEKLEYLNLSGDYIYWNQIKPLYIENIEGLNELINLKELYLSQQNLDNIENLNQLKKMEKLSLSWNRFTKINNQCFENLVGLNLSYNNLSSVSGKMEHMRELILASNNIRKIDSQFLANIKNECILDIRGNPIESFASLPENIKLKNTDWNKGELIFLT